MISQEALARDWQPPRSARAMTGIATKSEAVPWSASGVTVHCVTNCGIHCRKEDMEKNKGHISVTVVAIKEVGWGYAPWKKPKNPSVKIPKDPNARPLAEVADETFVDGQRVIRAARFFLFPREGKTDKGPREEGSVFTLTVGKTVHFGIQSFMFEDNKAHGVFPASPAYIPPFTLIEIAFGSNALPLEAKHEGYGLKLECIRPLEFTAYSYMTPQGLLLMPHTYETAATEASESSQANPNLSKMIEVSNVAFFTSVEPHTYLAEVEGLDGWYRLQGREGQPIAEGLYQMDIKEEDLLRYTNAGDHLGYARLVVDLAAAAGALRVYVCRGEFFNKQERALSNFRGFPLIDTEKLLVDVDVTQREDGETQREDGEVTLVIDCPKLEGMESPYLELDCTAKTDLENGLPLPCKDLAICSEACTAGPAYALRVCESEAPVLTIYYPTNPSAGDKRGRVVDYRALATLKSKRV